MSLTREVAAFAIASRPGEVSDEARALALDHIVDTFGVTLAGANEESARIVRRVYGLGRGKAGVWGTGHKGAPAFAALANGVAGHALDYDDTQLSTSKEAVYGLLTHPSVPVLSAATAVAIEEGASGEDLLIAYLVGVEVACRLADAMNPRHYQDGFHSTGTVGTLGAAAAAGRLLGLDEGAMARALGMAGSMASGLRENFGTMTKPLHSGRAAHNGTLAAYMAKEGFSASEVILEARRGFFRAAGGGFDASKVEGMLGKPYFLTDPGVSIKPYPSGSLSHPGQDVIIDLVKERDLKPQDVARVVVGTNSNVPNALIYDRPTTGLEGKFSLQYQMATGVVRRRAGLREFTDEGVNDPEIRAFLPKVEVVVDPELEAMGYQHVRTRVAVTLTDGTVLKGEAEWAKGYPTKPLGRQDLTAKFVECAETCLPTAQAQEAAEAIRSLPGARSVEAVLQKLQPAGAEAGRGEAS